MIVLDLENETRFKLPARKTLVDTVINVLKEKRIDGNFEIGLKVVAEKKIKELNHKYRKIDLPTDVLSFPIYKKLPISNEKPILLGDIIICFEVMVKNIKEYGKKPEEEFLHLVRHSVLHLLGYHHK